MRRQSKPDNQSVILIMIKRLYLIRHAKSSWEDPDQSDLERPLHKRGKRDAPFMSKLLKKEKVKADAIYTSPAVRALATAIIFAEELGFSKDKIEIEKKIYLSGIKELSEVVNSISEKHSTVLLFGHNPDLTNFCNLLGDQYIGGMPTCSIAGLEFNVKSWKDVERGCGKLILFEYPRKYLK